MNSTNREFGAFPEGDGVRFSVWSSTARQIWVCLFDEEGKETRFEMKRSGDGEFHAYVSGLRSGARYGYRADGVHDPLRGYWFDPDKLLVDPYALEIDAPFSWDPILKSGKGKAGDTANVVPKGIVVERPAKLPRLSNGISPAGVIYELQVRSFSILNPCVPEADRGTLRALKAPAVIAHLLSLGVSAVELMPVTAWIDEQRLAEDGLTNAWGYNPVCFFALDPRLAPGGMQDLREAVSALHAAGISVLLDVVFNHNGESDAEGPTISFRGLDALTWFRHSGTDRRTLVNDTGCGNTLNTQDSIVRQMILDCLRYFAGTHGIDGFRFDLAPVLGRTERGFERDAELIMQIATDPALADCVLIAEPWDIGFDGYQLGAFPSRFLEWNDRFRDDVRRFWRGDPGAARHLATRLCGSEDIFGCDVQRRTRTVNFISAHDGFSLYDLVSYQERRNRANLEENRDGHSDNLSWNHGVEGVTNELDVLRKRHLDAKALLSTLFLSRGMIMLTAGDEFGRTQFGNNNAYCQDNEITWLNWRNVDQELLDHARAMSAKRSESGKFNDVEFYRKQDVVWLNAIGEELTPDEWERDDLDAFAMVWRDLSGAVLINRSYSAVQFSVIGKVVELPARSVDLVTNTNHYDLERRS